MPRKSPQPKLQSRETSIRQKAYLHIQTLVTAGTLPAGASLSEVLLARELGSSRTPVREAMNQLAAEGLLETNANGGMTVARLTRADIAELYELREALEVYAVSKASTFAVPPTDRDRLQYLIDVILKLAEDLRKAGVAELGPAQMKRFLASDLAFHALLMNLANNSRMQKIVGDTRLLIRIFAIQRRGHDVSQLEIIAAGHQRILDAVVEQRRPDAVQALAEHIAASRHERLSEFDHWSRENELRRHMPAVFEEEMTAKKL
jgi:DNA-binding GntR family transcriptional regulator